MADEHPAYEHHVSAAHAHHAAAELHRKAAHAHARGDHDEAARLHQQAAMSGYAAMANALSAHATYHVEQDTPLEARDWGTLTVLAAAKGHDLTPGYGDDGQVQMMCRLCPSRLHIDRGTVRERSLVDAPCTGSGLPNGWTPTRVIRWD